MKKLIYFLLIGMLSMAVFGVVPALKAVAGENQGIRVQFQKIGQSTSTLEEDLQVPLIKGWKNQKAQQAINKEFLKAVNKFRQEMEVAAKEAKKEEENLGISTGKYQAITQGKALYNKNDLLAISLTYYQYTGGAHGMHYQEVFNIDLREGKILTLQNIFKPGTNYKKVIDREIKSQINRNSELFFPEGEGGFEGIRDNQSFLIKDDYLVFYFQPYEIACYAAGIPEFRIPFSKLSEMVKERFISQ